MCLYPGKLTHTLTGSMVDQLLLWAVEVGASDIVFRAADPPWIEVDGKWVAISENFALSEGETQLLTNYFSGQVHKAGNVMRGMSADFAYAIHIPESRGLVQRFRCNVTNTNCGHYLVLRVLPRDLPSLSDLQLEEGIKQYLYPENGVVLISGVMGSGKSTLAAAVLHAAILKPEYGGYGLGRQILTLEQPIEFDFSKIAAEKRTAPIAQSEVEYHVGGWAGGVRSLTRTKGEMVIVGEDRDLETLQALLMIVEQGVTAYATVHARDVPQTLTKIVHSFPEAERSAIAWLLKVNVRLIVHQRLVPKKGGGRIALREFLGFDEELRKQLYQKSMSELLPFVREAVRMRGQTLVEAARRTHNADLISDETYEQICGEEESC
ncbi:MAG: Flp pilus assembly complex ATPase component TadA [Desulfovibrio sp.]|nr:Flp pilus assembly complex ATPase component TadA [Desulfovibrio sp.]